MENHFGILDYISVVATLVFTALIGVYFARENKTNEDLLLGGRKINRWPVAISVMASYISAVTLIGYPAETFAYGVEIFNMGIVALICFPISILLFVPVLYPMKLTSIFEYLELRFGCKTLRKMMAGIYLFEQIALAGVILYGPSLVLVTFLGIPSWLSTFGIGLLCTLYTCVGGIRAVVWTDAFQGIVMILGMLAILVKALVNAGGVSQAFHVAKENGRLNLFKMNFDIFQRHNFFNFYIGFAFITLVRSTIHQQQVQRFSSQPTLGEAKKTMFLSVPITLTVKLIVTLTGIAVFALYYNCDPLRLGKIATVDHLVPYFVVTEMAAIPGILGLFTACIFSSVLSSISSTINSLTAVTWEDYLSTIPKFAKMDANGQANVSRVTGLVYGLLSVMLAFSAQYMGSVYSASYQVVGTTTGVVSAIFLAGLFTRFINATGAKVGAIVGLTSMMTIGIRSIFSYSLKEPMLPTSIDNCTSDQLASLGNSTATVLTQQKFIVEWPDKIFTISYLLYPLVGAIITLTVATIVSYFTGGFRDSENVPEAYLHPFVKTCRGRNIEKPEQEHIKTVNFATEDTKI